ncbi:MAG: PAS domain-containing sensor histidine kinase [Planctomycetota bacterium]
MESLRTGGGVLGGVALNGEPDRGGAGRLLIIGEGPSAERAARALEVAGWMVKLAPPTGPWPLADAWVVFEGASGARSRLRQTAENLAPRLPIVVVDEQADVEQAREWLLWGAADYFPAPGGEWPVDRLHSRLEALHLERCHTAQDPLPAAENDLWDDLERVMTFLDGIRDGVIFTDSDGAIIAINRSVERQLGISSLATLGADVESLEGPAELCALLTQGFERVLVGGVNEWNGEVLLGGLAGEPLAFEVSVLALPGAEEAARLGAVAILRDVSAVRRSERVKSQFLSIVSHELRAPLTAIKTFVSMLCQGRLGEVPDRQQRVLDDIRDQARRLEHEIDKVISLARLEGEDFERGDEEFPVRDLIEVACRPFSRTVEAKGLSLHLEMPAPDVLVRADFEDIKRALQALIENSIKFTPEGGEVRVWVEAEDESVVMRVQDTGIGIAPWHHELIFERFQQVERPLTRQFGGAGLGLSVARRILRAHDSDVELESAPMQGATFSFRLPRCPLAAPAGGTAPC